MQHNEDYMFTEDNIPDVEFTFDTGEKNNQELSDEIKELIEKRNALYSSMGLD